MAQKSETVNVSKVPMNDRRLTGRGSQVIFTVLEEEETDDDDNDTTLGTTVDTQRRGKLGQESPVQSGKKKRAVVGKEAKRGRKKMKKKKQNVSSSGNSQEVASTEMGGVQHVTMVPLRSNKQAVVTYTETPEMQRRGLSFSLQLDYEVKVESEGTDGGGGDDKGQVTLRRHGGTVDSCRDSCFGCCKKGSTPEEKMAAFHVNCYEANRLLKVVGALCFLWVGILFGLCLFGALVYALTTSEDDT